MEENFVRAVRKAAGLTQIQLAQAIGRSYQMVQQYEKGAPVPDEVLHALKTLAAQSGHADLAVERAPGHSYKPTAVIHPGETLIAAKNAPISVSAAERQRLHGLLDDILDSRYADAIVAVTSNLEVFGSYIRKGTVTPQKRRMK